MAQNAAPKRGAIVGRAAQLMIERKEEIARALSHEEGKLLAEARGEMQRTINILEFCGSHGRRLNGETIPLELADNFGYTIKQPLGVVALITPWNFPVAIPAWKMAPALVAGNTVVFKPASLTPETAALVVALLRGCRPARGRAEPGLRRRRRGGHGADRSPGRQGGLVHRLERGGAERLRARGAARGIRAQCEMGGKNPVIVLEDADLDLAVAGVAGGAFGSTGQRCTATSRVIVMRRRWPTRFWRSWSASAGKMRLGNAAGRRHRHGAERGRRASSRPC